jgi:5-formyltetrahydrofolate cyclo-ligase
MSNPVDPSVEPEEPDVRAQKQALRKEVRARLKELSVEQIELESQKVWDRLFEIPAYQQAKSIGVFLSMPKGEIHTDPVLLDATQKGKDIYVPQVGKNFEQCDMELLKVSYSRDEATKNFLFHHGWPRNKWGIPEPPPQSLLQPASPGDIDVLIVPGLAFDLDGNRLGQGKGYYDRFIARMMSPGAKPPALIAVGLDCQFVDHMPVPTHHHDQPMDIVLLPSRVIKINK